MHAPTVERGPVTFSTTEPPIWRCGASGQPSLRQVPRVPKGLLKGDHLRLCGPKFGEASCTLLKAAETLEKSLVMAPADEHAVF